MNAIAAAFVAACLDELEAPKPGNIHIFAEGHGMTVADFKASAEAAAAAMGNPALSVGARVRAGVEATFQAVNMNTNLGILLLCAPLAVAAEKGGDLRLSLRATLANLTRADASDAFKAIVHARPAGLGEAPRHDVHHTAEVTLLEAMREAAGRDRIAYQYSHDFVDIFETGLPALADAGEWDWPMPWPVVRAYLGFLAGFPDSHIARKHGTAAATAVQAEAVKVLERYKNTMSAEDALRDMLSFDERLKNSGLNPGTSADLTVATLFAGRLQHFHLRSKREVS